MGRLFSIKEAIETAPSTESSRCVFVFLCLRLKVFFRGSTSESNQVRATQVALNKFDELYNKVKSGGTLLDKSFKDLFNELKVHYSKVSNESLP
jgi:hypothetical protein